MRSMLCPLLTLFCLAGVLPAQGPAVGRQAELRGQPALLAEWLAVGGRGETVPGGLQWADGGASWLATGPIDAGRLTARIVPLRASRPGQWTSLGLRLFENSNRFWLLTLTQHPDGEQRWSELIEMIDGQWNIQTTEPYKLEQVPSEKVAWQWGEAVDLTLELTASGVRGTVAPASGAGPGWTGEYRFVPGVPVVRSGLLGLHAQEGVMVAQQVGIEGTLSDRIVSGSRAVVMAPADSADERSLTRLAEEAGFETRRVEPTAPELDYRADGLLLTASLANLPVPAMRQVADWVAAGGDLYTGGSAEPFANPLYPTAAGEWLPRAEALASIAPSGAKLAWDAAQPPSMASNDRTVAAQTEFGQPGPQGAPEALRLTVPYLTGWTTLRGTELPTSPFGPGQTLTVVWLRGTPGQSTTLEWIEDDGSRWIGALPLTDEWTRHVLAPTDFPYWPHDSKTDRVGTTFRPAHAVQFGFGPAIGHGNAHEGPVTVEIGPLGFATLDPGLDAFVAPVIETLSPWYKQYTDPRGQRRPIQRSRGLTAQAEPDGRHQLLRGGLSRYVTKAGAAIFWRPEGTASRAARGDAAALRSARAGLWLLNAGPTQVTYLPGEAVELGAHVLGAGATAAGLTGTLRAAVDDRPLPEVAVTAAAGAVQPVQLPAVGTLGPGLHQAVIELCAPDGAVVDRQDVEFRVASPADAPKPASRRLRVEGDRFVVDGQPVFLYGVNYWASNVAGLEPWRYDASWLNPLNYDPEVVERDLALMERLGINLVSIQMHHPLFARPLRDFLERCRAHGVWANLYTGSAADLGFDPERDVELLEAAGALGNDTVAMLDLAWEPQLGDQARRQRWDEEWHVWIGEQYGTLAQAEAAWGVAAPRAAGQVTNPTDQQIKEDGPWRIMVAAYRRFADDLISRRYGRVVNHLRQLDPDVLLGVRTGYGGTGQEFANGVLAYDVTSGAAHLDFTSPEGYGMPPAWEAARGTGFITAYSRWAGAGKPVFWSEFGASLGPNYGTPETRARQTDVWTSTLRLCAQDRAAACAGWWWPGGWRVGEQSDFGVVEPWGEPRAALAESAKLVRAAQRALAADEGEPALLTIDRDADSRGLHGLWRRTEAEYLRLRDEGRQVRLVTGGTDTTTRTMPREQIGGQPWQPGTPLRYANAEVTGLELADDDGVTRVAHGQRLPRFAGRATLTVSLVNTGEAAWDGCTLTLGDQTVALPLTPRFGRAVARFELESTPPKVLIPRVQTADGVPFGQAAWIAFAAPPAP